MAWKIGNYETITIGSSSIFKPNEMELEREDVYAGEYTTCTGRVIADLIGWRYADTDLSWDTLPDDQLAVINSLSGATTITFTDSDGTHTENIIRLGYVNAPTRYTGYDGEKVWKDVTMKVRFINVHND